MLTIKVHKFATKALGLSAMQDLNIYWELPKPGAESSFGEDSLQEHPDGFFYIIDDPIWTLPLGDSEQIELPEYNI